MPTSNGLIMVLCTGIDAGMADKTQEESTATRTITGKRWERRLPDSALCHRTYDRKAALIDVVIP